MEPRQLNLLFFFFNDTATTEIYPFPLHAALPISREPRASSATPLAQRGDCPAPRRPRRHVMCVTLASRCVRLGFGRPYITSQSARVTSQPSEIGRAHV